MICYIDEYPQIPLAGTPYHTLGFNISYISSSFMIFSYFFPREFNDVEFDLSCQTVRLTLVLLGEIRFL